jgi:hypothetical protein
MTSMLDPAVTRRRAVFWLTLSPALVSLRLVDSATPPAPPRLELPLKDGSLRFAVMGDAGRGSTGQMETARQMETIHALFPFDLVLMTGDNIYGSDGPADMKRKFETPYRALLDAGVRFQAARGNHDNPNQRFHVLRRPPDPDGSRLRRAAMIDDLCPLQFEQPHPFIDPCGRRLLGRVGRRIGGALLHA